MSTANAAAVSSYIALRARAMQAAGLPQYPSADEFVMLYGRADQYAVADVVDYLAPFVPGVDFYL
jgi:hypothetical protein